MRLSSGDTSQVCLSWRKWAGGVVMNRLTTFKGSGWAEYKKSGTVHGIQMPTGLVESQKLEKPLFTPSTKADQGEHDENIHPDKGEHASISTCRKYTDFPSQGYLRSRAGGPDRKDRFASLQFVTTAFCLSSGT